MALRLLPRLALRQSRLLVQRRAASTTTEATQAASQSATAAKETAQSTVSKAQEGLSRVTSSAGPALSKAASSAGNALSGMGGRTGAVVNWVQGMMPHVIYYGRVAGELGRLIYTNRGMQPPTLQTIQSYVQPVTNALRNPTSIGAQAARTAESGADSVINNPQSFLTRLRNLDGATLTSVGIIAAETVGFFSVGEMIGRFKVVGYRGGHHHDHH